MTDAELIEEVEHLLGSDSVHSIAARVGFRSPSSLGKRLERAGRQDLSRRFWRKANEHPRW